MLRYLTKKRKQTRKEKNYVAVKEIFKRGALTLPAEYLTVHREADQETKDRVLAAAAERRARRQAKQSKSKVSSVLDV